MTALRFEGKVAIITGKFFSFSRSKLHIPGSSTGIGRETARLFVEQGAKVIYCGRSPQSLKVGEKRTAEKLNFKETRDALHAAGATDETLLEIQGDLTNEKLQENLIKSTIDKFGKLDILVNNAAGAAPDNTKTAGFESDMDVYDYVMNLNLRRFDRGKIQSYWLQYYKIDPSGYSSPAQKSWRDRNGLQYCWAAFRG